MYLQFNCEDGYRTHICTSDSDVVDFIKREISDYEQDGSDVVFNVESQAQVDAVLAKLEQGLHVQA